MDVLLLSKSNSVVFHSHSRLESEHETLSGLYLCLWVFRYLSLGVLLVDQNEEGRLFRSFSILIRSQLRIPRQSIHSWKARHCSDKRMVYEEQDLIKTINVFKNQLLLIGYHYFVGAVYT